MSAPTTAREDGRRAARSTEAPGAPASSEVAAPHRTRADLQGLRALAVVAVLLDHAWGWPRGGFVGVDVFFVLSGYLITDLMLRERARTGRVSLLGFYRRRVKRILPVALLVLVVTVLAGRVLLARPRWLDTVTDAAWSAVFAANWRFGSVGTDYFASDRPPSPLQHFWSLAVEEQFYVLWPTVVILAVGWRVRRGGGGRLLLGGLATVLVISSLVWAFARTASAPDLAYFSSLTRFWEIGAGALLAVVAPLLPRWPVTLGRVVSWAGLAGVLASYALISDGSAFPAPWALLPVLSAVAVIASGTLAPADAHEGPWLLTNPVSRYVGDMSYSLYLWHFPVIILGAALLGDGPVATGVLTVTAVVVAFYSYELVEDPLRRTSWRAALARRVRRTDRARSTPDPRLRQVAYSLAAVLVVTALASAASLGRQQTDEPVDLARPSSADFGALTEAEEDWRPQVEKALQATSWPRLQPDLDSVIDSPQAPSDVVRCGAAGDAIDVEDCTWGSAAASRSAVVLGDSVSLTYVAPLRDLMTAGDRWSLTSLGTFGCPFVDLPIGSSRAEVATCADRRAQAVRAIRDLDPDLVLVSDSVDTPPRFPTGDSVSEREWRDGLAASLADVRAPGRDVVLLAPPPGDADPGECYNALADPADCVSPVSDDWTARAMTERDLARTSGWGWINSAPWFCAAQRCPIFVDGTPVRSDRVHMTLEYAERMRPLLRSALAAVGPELARAVGAPPQDQETRRR